MLTTANQITFDRIFRMMSRAEKRGCAESLDTSLDVVQFLVGKMTSEHVQFRRLMELAEEMHERCELLTPTLTTANAIKDHLSESTDVESELCNLHCRLDCVNDSESPAESRIQLVHAIESAKSILAALQSTLALIDN